MTLGDVIIQYRTEHNLSQRQFAIKCGISNGYIAMIEKNMNPLTGKPIILGLEKLKAIATAMNLTADELMRIVDGGTPISMEKDSSVTDQELLAFAQDFSRLPEEKQKQVLDYMKFLLSQHE